VKSEPTSDHRVTTIMKDAAKSIVPLIVLFVIAPLIYQDQFLFFLLAILLVCTNALNIVYGFTGYLPFGFAVFVAFGAYTAAMTVNLLHFPVWLAVVSAGLSSVLLSLVFTPLLRLNGAYFAIASLAAFEAVYNIYQNGALRNITGGPYGIFPKVPYTPNLDYITVVLLAIASSLLILFIKRSDFGLALQAIRDDRYAVETVGVNTLMMRTYAWVLSSLLTGLAGGMYGLYIGFFYPSGVFDLTQFSVLVIIFLIFGGRGTYLGPLIGTVILFLLYQFLNLSFPNLYLLVFGVIIILVMLFLPDGVISVLQKRVKGVL